MSVERHQVNGGKAKPKLRQEKYYDFFRIKSKNNNFY